MHNGVNIVDDYLSKSLLYEIREDLLQKQEQHVWGISKLKFGAGLTIPDADGSLLLSRLTGNLRQKLLKELAVRRNIEISPQEEKWYSTVYYIGLPHSALDWHRDYLYEWAVSLYLTLDWDAEYGGLFEYVDEETQRNYLITPKLNRAVEQIGDVHHRVTPISAHAPIRPSIQIFKNLDESVIKDKVELKKIKLATLRENHSR